MAKVYKRKLPSGNISWIADFTDPFTGLRKRESFAKKKLADAKIDEITYRKIRGEPVNTGKVLKTTLGDLVEDFKTKCVEQNGLAHWTRNRKFAIERFESHFGSQNLVATIQYRHIEDYRDWLKRLPTRRKAERKGSTVNRELAQIRKMFRRGQERGLVLRNPFKEGSSLREKETARDRHLSEEEFKKLMAECAPHLRFIVLAATASGLRRGSLLRLTWDMVDFEQDCIHVPGEMVKNKQPLNVPITGLLRQVLKAEKKEQLEQHLAQGRKGRAPEHVFTYSKKLCGQIVTKQLNDIKTGFRAACRRAKLKDVRFHDLRHTFATHLRDADVDMFMIGALLGHSWTTMTQRYAHENLEAKKKAISNIESLIAETVVTYWHTLPVESDVSTVKQASNA